MGNAAHHAPRLSPREGKHTDHTQKEDVEDALVGLPLEVAQSYSEIHKSGYDSKKDGWVKYRNGRGGQMYYKEFLPESKEFIRTTEMVEKYLGEIGELECTKILQVYNDKSLNEFYKKWSSSTSIPVEFEISPRSANNPAQLAKQHVKKSYSELLDKNNYNTDKFANTILLTAHGSEEVYAFEIAMQGFSECATSNGGFGDGIYTMTDPRFCYPYFRGARAPVILLSWVLPGDVNFISSEHDDVHLSKNKFSSNFVCVDHTGVISENIEENKYQQIIVANDNQYLPAFILFLSRDNFQDLDGRWNRKIVDPKLFQPDDKSKEHKPDADLEHTEVHYYKMESSSEEKENSKLIWKHH